MDFIASCIPYRQTGCFSQIVLDYIDNAEQLKPFFIHPPTVKGVENAIKLKQKQSLNREILTTVLTKQYDSVSVEKKVSENIESLQNPNTFTICTAHQPNIFTGPLYFIYKIVHAIKLADHLNTSLPKYRFVPVYYMGSEDADLDELGHIYLNGVKLEWNTKQKGAVGRMKIDDAFLKLITAIDGQLKVMAQGEEVIKLVRECYKEGITIQEASFRFVNSLFGKYGLIVFLPDNSEFKKQVIHIFKDDLLEQKPSAIVEKTSKQLNKQYKIQAQPREVNLFYLNDGIRERITKNGDNWKVIASEIQFNEKELISELSQHPEYFSPNVILRGIFQESVLPNVVFMGGGGELGYWLQLKELFAHYEVPFPVLVLRNSFAVVEKKWQEKIRKLQFNIEDFFIPEQQLMTRLVERETKNQIRLNGTFTNTVQLYDAIKQQAAAVDLTLGEHVEALKSTSLRRLHELEKKMLRAEKRRFADQQRQIQTIRQKLFPGGGLQERYDNMLYYYANWGNEFIEKVYKHSLNLEQEFMVLLEKT